MEFPSDPSSIDRRSTDEPIGEVVPLQEINLQNIDSRRKRSTTDDIYKNTKKCKYSNDFVVDNVLKTTCTQYIPCDSNVLKIKCDAGYVPCTTETKAVYKAMLYIVSKVLPDADKLNVTKESTNKVLIILKDVNFTENERKAKVENLLGSGFSESVYADLLSLANKLYDFANQEGDDVNFEFEGEEDDIDMEECASSYQNIDLDNLIFSKGSHFMSNETFNLPHDYQNREPGTEYNLVCIPSPNQTHLDDDELLVKIADLPAFCISAFEKRETLNNIESQVCKTALKTDANILLCAPTGAGKTDVALMCMMREIGKNINNEGTICKDTFKIVYIAPMESMVIKMTASLGERLKSYNLKVGMLSDDSHRSRQEISETQVIVCTPEKWDGFSRKSYVQTYTQLVKLFIIDQIHLLHDERGPLLEAIVARAVRSMEAADRGKEMRIVGLSANLPNTEDVAAFIRVNRSIGLFIFDDSYRPVPLKQEVFGIYEMKPLNRLKLIDEILYDEMMYYTTEHQVLIFEHKPRNTVGTAKCIIEKCTLENNLDHFLPENAYSTTVIQEYLPQIKNGDLYYLLHYGLAIYHEELDSRDRMMVEQLFKDKHIKVVVSTSRFAWEANLEAPVVIIKGTREYRADKGDWTELRPLDVMQMFGCACLPETGTNGVGILITDETEMTYYLSLLNEQLTIESQFMSKLVDHLNAEVVMGTVNDMESAIQWMKYLYLYIRMTKNPAIYGVKTGQTLKGHINNLIYTALKMLERGGMIVFDEGTGCMQSTEMGRIAADYYCSHDTMAYLDTFLKNINSPVNVFQIFSKCPEFNHVSVRYDEKEEIKKLMAYLPKKFTKVDEEASQKICRLLQAYICRLKIDNFTLSSDSVFVSQSAARLMRAMFEVALTKKWAILTNCIIKICKEVEQRMLFDSSPLRQFKKIPFDIIKKWETTYVSLEEMGRKTIKYLNQIPALKVEIYLQPITRSTLRVELTIAANFNWCPKTHGTAQGFWIFVEDECCEQIIHSEFFLLKEKLKDKSHILKFYVPIFDPLPSLYCLRIFSDRWITRYRTLEMKFNELRLPNWDHPSTELLDLERLSIPDLINNEYADLYPNMALFNAIQTQCFKSLYDSDENVFIGAPSGAGKTLCAELAMFRLFSKKPNGRCVYVTAQEDVAETRYEDWSKSFGDSLQKTVVKLTGNTSLDYKIIARAHIIVATAENWDALSRQWQDWRPVQNIQLFIADDLHLIGSHQNGATLEVVCSRSRYLCSQLETPFRIIGLSYSLTNARDVGKWLGCTDMNTYNFHPNVRHRPLHINVSTFHVTHNATRLSSMNKPVYQAIIKQSPDRPVIVFIPTMHQVEETALLLKKFALADNKKFCRDSEGVHSEYMRNITNEVLIESLPCGIGFIHEGLTGSELTLIKNLFSNQIIQILLVSQSLCWTIGPDAYLVIVMDTQFYNAKDCMYDDYSVVDLIQMVGRANNPSYDHAKALIMCQSNKKEFIQKFLLEPLTLESHLNHQLHDHFNAEIVNKTIKNEQDAVDYLTRTFLHYRITKNPTYYNLTGTTYDLVIGVLDDLEIFKCITIKNETDVEATNLGMIAANYYIHYKTIYRFELESDSENQDIYALICRASEFGNLTMRHGEDILLDNIRQHLGLPMSTGMGLTDSRNKANVLLQAHLARIPIYPSVLKNDSKKIVLKCESLILAMVDVVSSRGWLGPALAAMELAQNLTQAQWPGYSDLKQIPHFDNPQILERCEELELKSVFDVLECDVRQKFYVELLTEDKLQEVERFLQCYPNIDLRFEVTKKVNLGENIVVAVTLTRDEDNIGAEVYAPHFPSPKEEKWWLVVGDPSQGHLISIKLLPMKTDNAELKFQAPEIPGTYEYGLYFMCDSYLGCDQEYKFYIEVD